MPHISSGELLWVFKLCLCVCTYIHTHMYVCSCMYICVVCAHACVCMQYMCICAHARVCVHVGLGLQCSLCVLCTCAHVFMCVHICVRVFMIVEAGGGWQPWVLLLRGAIHHFPHIFWAVPHWLTWTHQLSKSVWPASLGDSSVPGSSGLWQQVCAAMYRLFM